MLLSSMHGRIPLPYSVLAGWPCKTICSIRHVVSRRLYTHCAHTVEMKQAAVLEVELLHCVFFDYCVCSPWPLLDCQADSPHLLTHCMLVHPECPAVSVWLAWWARQLKDFPCTLINQQLL